MKKMLNLLKKCVIVAAVWLSIPNIILPPPAFPFDPGISTCQESPNLDEAPLEDSDY